MKDIVVRGAREHNLKDLTVTIPRDKLTVITGLSGSGKSSLAFDTIYAEGQRRYVESLSAYARQFLGQMSKPDVDSIEGLSPAISIEQKSTSKNPRSTVGTVTEIYDYLRLLFARVGIPHDPRTGEEIKRLSAEQVTQNILQEYEGEQITLLTPIITQKKGTHEQLVADLAKQGYTRVRIDGQLYRTDEEFNLERYVKHDIEAVEDRIRVSKESRSRLAEAVERSMQKGGQIVRVLDEEENTKTFSAFNAPENSSINYDKLEPRLFSFNSPFGACKRCHGIGNLMQFSEELVVPDKTLSLVDGAVAAWSKRIDGWRVKQIKKARNSIDVFAAFEDLTVEEQEYVLRGGLGYEGVLPMLDRLYHQTDSDYRRRKLENYMIERACPVCEGKRLREEILAITVQEKNIIEVTNLSIQEAYTFFTEYTVQQHQEVIVRPILKEVLERLQFLINVGLEYLTLSRSAGTLSGGEAQRIRLATQIGSNLMGVMYVLDEPSIGLHQRDNQKLIDTLKGLRDLGNTVIVVEHDEDTIQQADHVIDLGPGAGRHGGSIVAQGTPQEVAKSNSVTGAYLSGHKAIHIPNKRRTTNEYITLTGCRENNLKNVRLEIPVGIFTCVTGVSGSGKSTLITTTLQRALRKQLMKTKETPGEHDTITIPASIEKVVEIDQSPIGRTPRSNPATYTKVFDDIRKLFSETKESRVRGYEQGRFSFNVKGGRCETCKGDGQIKIEMNFLPDVYVECEQCNGARYNEETLEIQYKGKTIAQVLDMTVEEALEFFSKHPSIKRKLKTLSDVGLDYIKLGQASTTLSGGEAQRIKLTRELAKQTHGRSVYILDEPTTGLHFEDIKKLLKVLQRLVEKKNTIVVIEHNLDVIKSSDFIIDLGLEGGEKGGRIVATGNPEEVAEMNTYTGKYLKRTLLHAHKKDMRDLLHEEI